MADGRFFFILIVQFSCNSKKAEKKSIDKDLSERIGY